MSTIYGGYRGLSISGDLMFVNSKKTLQFINRFMALSESLTEAPSSLRALAQQAKGKGVEHYGKGYYGPIGQKGKASATYKSDNGKLVALSDKEKKALGKGQEPAATPVKKPASRLAAKAAKQAPQTKPAPSAKKAQGINIDLDKVPGAKNHPLRKDPVFVKFLKNPTAAAAQYLQDTYNMMFNNNKLYVGTIAGKKTSGDAERKPFGESPAGRELGRMVAKAISDLGVEIPAKGLDAAPGAAKEKPKGREAFKATNLFGKEAVQLISSEGYDGGVKIGNNNFREVKFPQNYVNRVVDELKKRNPNATSEQLKEAKNLAESAIKMYERKIEKLKQIQDLPAYRFTGEEGTRQITTSLLDAIRENTNDQEFRKLRQIVGDIFSAKDVTELRASYQNFINNTPKEMSGALPYIAEMFSAIHQVNTKGEVIIPANDTFKLADVIGLGSTEPSVNPVDLANRINFVFVDSDDFEPDLDTDQISVSTKVDKGSASSNYTKYEETDFYVEYGGKKYTNVKSDLLGVSKVRNTLFGKGGPQAFRDSKTQVVSFVDNYREIIADYYGLDKNTKTKDLMKILSTGKPPICGPDGMPVAAPESASPLNTNPANAESWQMWSVLGHASDAVHNKMVNFQGYSTHVYKKDGSMHIADGLAKLSASKFQFYKNLQATPDGNKMPDQELNAFTVPASRTNIRSGNPCAKGATPKKRK